MRSKKYFYKLLFVALIGLIGIGTIFNPTTDQSNNSLLRSESKSQNAMPPGAMEQLMQMTIDPKLKRRTPENLLKTRELIKKGHYKNYKDFTIDNWTERGPVNVAGRTRSLIIDQNDPSGNTVWAGSVSGGLWETTNFLSDDITWSPINDFFQNIAISSMIQDPNAPDNMYFGTGEGWFNADAVSGLGIWKSSDGGINWDQLSSTNNYIFSFVQKLIITEQDHIYACTRFEGLQRSTDGGATWTKVLGGGVGGAFSNRAADIEKAANGDLYVSLGIFSTDGIYKSTDGGDTWIELMNSAPQNGLPTTGFQRIELATAPSNENIVYAVLQDGETSNCYGIYKTMDAGISWDSLGIPLSSLGEDFTRGQSWYDLIAQVDPLNASIVYVGGIDLLRSVNGGQTWSPLSHWYGHNGLPVVHADQHNITFHPDDRYHAIIGNDGGVYQMSIDSSLNYDQKRYCLPWTGNRNIDFISNFSLAAINNSSSEATHESRAGYTDFTHISTELNSNETYNWSISVNRSLNFTKISGWIDFNNNEVFDDSELVIEEASSATLFGGNFTVPSDALHLRTRMRIRFQFGDEYVPHPCNGSGYINGETEDYSVIINNCVAGITCDDRNICTINDVLDENCNCRGELADYDGNGSCDELSNPQFESKNWNYNVTQFYSCAIHPEAGSNVILGGTQDNGTQLFTQPGLNATRTVTGGDGAFCFIDQDQPNIHISTYIYNNFYITNDNWDTRENLVIGSNSGFFINPMDYDSETNTLYSSYEPGYISRIRNVGSENIIDSIKIDAIGTTQVTAITVDPIIPNKVWIASSKSYDDDNTYLSQLVSITNADSDYPIIGDDYLEFSDPDYEDYAYTRCLRINPIDSNKMLLLFSNAGINNLWYTADGGSNWTNIDGNLPNLPMFWVLFDPAESEGAIIASEMGIWVTDTFDGANTNWTIMNEGLANVRVDMLKFRPSDNTLVAATHGRGIFTTTLNVSCDSTLDVSLQLTSNSTLSIVTTGGVKPYTYQWAHNDSLDCVTLNQLPPGTYSVVVTDSLGCTGFADYNISQGPIIKPDLISSAGGSFSSPDLLFGWTIGESFIDQSVRQNVRLTEGFHQGYPPTKNLPDFVIDMINLEADQAYIGEEFFRIDFKVSNIGGVDFPINQFLYTNIYLSRDSTVDESDLLLGSNIQGELNAMTSVDAVIYTTFDSTITDGNYHIIVSTNSDSNIIESQYDNNQQSQPFILLDPKNSAPDFEAVELIINQDTYFGGEFLIDEAAVVVRNNGIVTTPSEFVFLYLSDDSDISIDDSFLGGTTIDPIQPNEIDTLPFSLSISDHINPGNYFILGCIDEFNFIIEVYEDNNCIEKPITIGDTSDRADLVISHATMGDSLFFSGDQQTLNFTIQNIGDTKANSTFLNHSIYLSRDSIPSPDEILMRSFTFDPISSNEEISIDALISFDYNLEVGTYYIIIELDSEQQLIEADENNNISILPISILPRTTAPDLTIMTASVSEYIEIGGPVNLNFIIENVGLFRVLESIYGIYLSQSNFVDESAIRIAMGNVSKLGIGQNANIDSTFIIPDSIQSGLWNIIITADEFYRRYESNESNNRFVLENIMINGANTISRATYKSSKESIYPNPTRAILYVSNTTNLPIQYQVVSPNGVIHKRGILDQKNRIDTKDLNPGIYFLLLENQGSQEMKHHRFIKL